MVGEGSHCLCRAQEATSEGAGYQELLWWLLRNTLLRLGAWSSVPGVGGTTGRLGWCGWAFPGLVLPPHPSTGTSQCPQTSFSSPCAERPGRTLAKLGTEGLVLDRPGPPSGCRGPALRTLGLLFSDNPMFSKRGRGTAHILLWP